MSHVVCSFAVKADGIGEPELLAAISEVIADLDAELRLPVVMARLAGPSVAERTGERFFVLETRGGDRSLARAPFLERLSAVCAVSAFGYDDRRGVHVYERCGDTRGPRRLVSVGPFLEGDLEALGRAGVPAARPHGGAAARARRLPLHRSQRRGEGRSRCATPRPSISGSPRIIRWRAATTCSLRCARSGAGSSSSPARRSESPRRCPRHATRAGLFDAAPAGATCPPSGCRRCRAGPAAR
jgi:hypothetical protein